jgi:hypothetical protein
MVDIGVVRLLVWTTLERRYPYPGPKTTNAPAQQARGRSQAARERAA